MLSQFDSHAAYTDFWLHLGSLLSCSADWMDVQECIDVYNSMFEEIFGSPVHKFKVTVAFQIQSQFDSEILRRCILRIVAKSQNLAGDDKKAIATATSLPGSPKAKDALISSALAKVLLDDGEARGCRT